ncbi:MAG: LamB/YcsF family protein [Alphaproteobacteria bacterium]
MDTICLHGDTPEAIEIAKSTRQALHDRGTGLEKFTI